MVVVVAVLVLMLGALTSAQTYTGCRVCQESCVSVPRSDGSCPVCICDGVALADCPANVTLECAPGCTVGPGPDGCGGCDCPQPDPVVCPALQSCSSDCQTILDDNGCPGCVCSTPKVSCPPVTCHDGCTMDYDEDGCRRCRCDGPGTCPAVPRCLRGCINRDDNSGCFLCNCTLVPKNPVAAFERTPTPFGFEMSPFEPEPPSEFPLRPEVSVGAAQPNQNSFAGPGALGGPWPRCRNGQRLRCPPGCRIAVGRHGCRECYCGDDAHICPKVPRCKNLCLFLSPGDRCCKCQCSQRPQNVGFGVSVGNGSPFPSFMPFGPFGPTRPNSPSNRRTGVLGLPFLPPFLDNDDTIFVEFFSDTASGSPSVADPSNRPTNPYDAPGYRRPNDPFAVPFPPRLPAPAPGYPAPVPGYPAPATRNPAPAPVNPAPAPRNPSFAQRNPAPAPRNPAPAPRNPAPAPRNPAPAPRNPAPAPGNPAPAPRNPAPAPRNPAPAPRNPRAC
ncbi:DNA-directed RNA polymerase II subunit RPB1-like 8 [Homarus americanus]|uniref:DNA-directed RNA polymerase II subunit RPB1-like 8 n=1 Tax=Homarus americanus TaxID=6706 RepID=A0A8J5JS03_HOMAM|nr:DNA-directed RNA polymerase II subunit RPB1-like 8 [Homarus americanus]